MSTSAQAVFEPCSRETWRDPFTMYQALRDHDPVHHVEPGGEDDRAPRGAGGRGR
jgi:hypothetical protein